MLKIFTQRLLHNGDILILYLSALFLFIYTAPPTIFLGDSGDMTNAAALFGVAHDPGYPLYSILGFIFQKLFVFGTIAWRMNVFSAIWAAGALVIVYVLVRYLTKNYVASFVAAAVFGLSSTFWLFSITAEVFSLHVFLSLLFLYALIRFYIDKQRKYLFLAAFAFSLEIAHQHMIILWVPGALVLLLASRFWKHIRKKDFIIAVGIGISGLLWYLYLPISQVLSGRYYWRDGTNIGDVIAIFLRKSYGTFDIQVGGSAVGGVERVRYLPVYGLLALYNFSIAGIVLAIAGVLHGLRTRTVIVAALLINFFVSGILFIAYAGLQLAGLFRLGMIEKFSLMSFSVLAVCIGLGVDWLINNQFIQNAFKNLGATMYIRLASVLVLMLPLYLFLSHWDNLNLRGFRGGWAAGVDMVFNVPADSLVAVVSDTLSFNARYMTDVEGYRDDTIVISSPYPPVNDRLEAYVKERGLASGYNPEDPLFVQDIVDQNFQEVPFLVRTRPVGTPEGKFFHPLGMTMRLYKTVEFDPEMQVHLLKHFLNNSFYINTVYQLDDTLPAYARSINVDYSTTLSNIGWFFIAYADAADAIPVFELGKEMDPSNVSHYVGLSFVYRGQNLCQDALSILAEYPNMDGSNYYEILREKKSVYKLCLNDDAQAQAIQDMIDEEFGEETSSE